MTKTRKTPKPLTAEQWNEKHPVGTPVRYWPVRPTASVPPSESTAMTSTPNFPRRSAMTNHHTAATSATTMPAVQNVSAAVVAPRDQASPPAASALTVAPTSATSSTWDSESRRRDGDAPTEITRPRRAGVSGVWRLGLPAPHPTPRRSSHGRASPAIAWSYARVSVPERHPTRASGPLCRPRTSPTGVRGVVTGSGRKYAGRRENGKQRPQK